MKTHFKIIFVVFVIFCRQFVRFLIIFCRFSFFFVVVNLLNINYLSYFIILPTKIIIYTIHKKQYAML